MSFVCLNCLVWLDNAALIAIDMFIFLCFEDVSINKLLMLRVLDFKGVILISRQLASRRTRMISNAETSPTDTIIFLPEFRRGPVEHIRIGDQGRYSTQYAHQYKYQQLIFAKLSNHSIQVIYIHRLIICIVANFFIFHFDFAYSKSKTHSRSFSQKENSILVKMPFKNPKDPLI